MLKKLFFFLLFIITFITKAQNVQLSVYAEISIITSGAGDALYEKFGHTAIRVKDPVLQLDQLYNYGIFDFDDPNFYLNFVKGYMKYKLAAYPFHYALQSANNDGRWVKEQILNLTKEQKNLFFQFLLHNTQPENAGYLYDPFFDNCATKPRDIIKKILGEQLVFSNQLEKKNKSLRQLMNEKINQNTWGSVGINIALGNRLDKTCTAEEYMYLPDYVFAMLAESKIKQHEKEVPLIKKTNTLLDFKEKRAKSNVINPLFVFSILLLVGSYITKKDFSNNTRTKWLDFMLFFITGCIGVLILFLWFFTNHSTAPNNFNLLWGCTPNVIIAFYILKKNPPKWIKKYISVLLVLLVIIPFVWLFGIQQFNWVLTPIFFLLAFRYLFLQKTL